MPFERATFFAALRHGMGSLQQDQVDGINTILMAWESEGEGDPRHLAYMLATAWHETDSHMQPIREYGRGKGKKYGPIWYGRGYVQLTWKPNYQKAGAKLGIDMLTNPDLALSPGIAARIMIDGMREGWFTGKKLKDYFNLGQDDPVHARRIINGMDRANLIAGYYHKFRAALTASHVMDKLT